MDDVREPYNPSTVQTFNASPKAGFGKVPDLERGKVPEDWWYFPVVARLHNQRTGYPTQKPESLMERIILASSRPGDLVADFFCGSGTTPAVAARLGRRFIAADNIFRAVHTTRVRLSDLPIEPFTLERQAEYCFPLGTSSKTAMNVRSDSIHINGRLDLDYWEVDPAWDGQIFKSAAQARRPVRNGELSREIKIKTGPNMCVRLITVKGKMLQKELNV